MCTIVSSLALVAFSKKIVYIVHESMLLKRESMIDGIIKGLCKRESKMKIINDQELVGWCLYLYSLLVGVIPVLITWVSCSRFLIGGFHYCKDSSLYCA